MISSQASWKPVRALGDLYAMAPPPDAPPVAFAQYDPATGTYLGPDGRTYTQSDLARNAAQQRSWQSMLTAPTHN